MRLLSSEFILVSFIFNHSTIIICMASHIKNEINYGKNKNWMRIDLRNMNQTSIPIDLLEGADQVQTLWMDNNPLLEFPVNKEILDSKSLRYFYCSCNAVSRIYDNSLRLLPNLNTLYLENNKIAEISPNAFKENALLADLHFGDNQLSSLEIVQPFPTLEVLKLNNNPNFKFIPYVPLIVAPELLNLNVSSCGIDEIYSETFEELAKIISIDFTNNQIKSFGPNVFARNRKLRDLIFSDNPLTSIAFKSKSLTFLECNNCLISALDAETLEYLPKLEELHLNNNNIKSINSYSFFHNMRLVTISFDNNRLESFDIELVEYLTELRSLCLDWNPFVPSRKMTQFKNYYGTVGMRQNCATSNSTQYFDNLLPSINVENGIIMNNAVQFPDYFPTINVTNMNLVYIEPTLFENNFNLQTLILNQNQNYKFWVDSPFLFNKVLAKIACHGCGIDQIFSNTFTGLPNLTELIISNNRISELPLDVFKNNKRLERLDLSDNNLRRIKYFALDSAENLKVLILDNNKEFNFYPHRVFLYNEILLRFSCNNCGIRRIYKDTFEKLRSLRTLDLKNNSIEFIDSDSFLKNKDLEALYLDGNKLITFDVSIVHGLPSLVELCLDNNINYDFKFSENNALLKQEYYHRKLRSNKCTFYEFSGQFEVNLKALSTSITSSTTISSSLPDNDEFMYLINKIDSGSNSSRLALFFCFKMYLLFYIFLLYFNNSYIYK